MELHSRFSESESCLQSLHTQTEGTQNTLHFGVSDIVDSKKSDTQPKEEANSGWLVAGIEVKKSCSSAQI